MLTVRDVIQTLLFNCDLDDRLIIAHRETNDDNIVFIESAPSRIFSDNQGNAYIECYDDEVVK